MPNTVSWYWWRFQWMNPQNCSTRYFGAGDGSNGWIHRTACPTRYLSAGDGFHCGIYRAVQHDIWDWWRLRWLNPQCCPARTLEADRGYSPTEGYWVRFVGGVPTVFFIKQLYCCTSSHFLNIGGQIRGPTHKLLMFFPSKFLMKFIPVPFKQILPSDDFY
jgi:hypothetical protein